jgi:hypothetical protein
MFHFQDMFKILYFIYIYIGEPKMYTHFKKVKNCIKIVMVLRSSNDNCASAIFFDCPACRIHLINAIFLTNVLLHIATVIM